jgi:trk system potassium uptake protein TrkA
MRVLIVGATDEALDIIRELVKNKHEVVVVDDNKSRIDRVVQELDIAAHLFSFIDLEVFQQIGMHRADAVIAMHPIDTINIIVCTIAKYLRVPKVYAIVNSRESANILEKLGLSNSVKVKSRAMFKEVLEMVYNIKIAELDDKYYLVIATVEEGSNLIDKKVEEVEDEGVKVLTIVSNDNNVVNFDKNYSFKKNDKVLFIVDKGKFSSFLSSFT